jgi:hypothetical protein
VHRLLAVWIVLGAAPAAAAPIHGLVYDDANGDGRPSAGERGVANAVVALGVQQFVVTGAQGQFTLDVPASAQGTLRPVRTALPRGPGGRARQAP